MITHPGKINLRKELFIPVYSPEQSFYHGEEDMAAGRKGRYSRSGKPAGHISPTVRKQREMNGDTQLPSSFLFNPGPNREAALATFRVMVPPSINLIKIIPPGMLSCFSLNDWRSFQVDGDYKLSHVPTLPIPDGVSIFVPPHTNCWQSGSSRLPTYIIPSKK